MPTLPPPNLVVEPIIPGHCSNVFITWDQPADADAAPDIVGGGTYSAGIKVVTVIPGKMYHFIKGANETSLVNGTETWTTSIYFQAQGATVTLNGAGAVTAVIKTMLAQTYRVYRNRDVLYEMPATEHQNQQPIVDPDRSELTFYTYRVDSIDSSGGIASSPLTGILMPECTPTGFPIQYGGMIGDRPNAATLDSSGNVIACGTLQGMLSPLLVVAKINSSGVVVWTKYYPYTRPPQPQGSTSISSVTTDASGNIFFAGHFNGTINFGDGWVQGNTNQTLSAFVVKLNSSGVLQFKITKVGTRTFGTQIALSSGNIFIAGIGSPDIEGWAGSRGFIDKYNSSGVLQWGVLLGDGFSSNNFACRGLSIDSSGDVHVVGQTEPGNLVICGETIFSATPNIILTKVSGTDGSCVWVHTYGLTEYGAGSVGNALALDSLGNHYIAGSYTTNGSAGGDRFPQASNYASPIIAKYDSLGNHVWSVGVPMLGGGFFPTGILLGDNDNIFVFGTSGAGRLIFSDGTYLQITAPSGLILKYSSAGTRLSASLFHQGLYAVAIAPGNQLMLAGEVETTNKGADILIDFQAQ